MFPKRKSRTYVAPNLESSPPRPARYTLLPRLAHVFCLGIWTVVTGAIVTRARADLGELTALQRGGVVMRSVMHYSYDRFGKRVTFCDGDRYLAGSHTFERDGQCTLARYAMVIEEPAVITYLPSQPEIVRVGVVTDRRIDTALMVWVSAVAVGGFAAALLMSWCLWGFTLQHRLLSRGIAQEALVTAKGYTQMLGRTVYAVFYTFSVGDQQYIHGTRISRGLFQKFEQGKKITILHLPENPDSSLPVDTISAARM